MWSAAYRQISILLFYLATAFGRYMVDPTVHDNVKNISCYDCWSHTGRLPLVHNPEHTASTQCPHPFNPQAARGRVSHGCMVCSKYILRGSKYGEDIEQTYRKCVRFSYRIEDLCEELPNPLYAGEVPGKECLCTSDFCNHSNKPRTANNLLILLFTTSIIYCITL